jgi:hypothetical protein
VNELKVYGLSCTVQEGDQVGKMHSADHGEVTGVRVLQHTLLLVHGCLSVSESVHVVMFVETYEDWR